MENKERQREGLAHIDREIRNECRSLWGATEHPSGGSEWVLMPGVNYLGRSTSIILAGGSEA